MSKPLKNYNHQSSDVFQPSIVNRGHTVPNIFCPPLLDRLLRHGAALVISISGGKDSQAMLVALIVESVRRGWTGTIFAVHADLGAAEWSSAHSMCQKMSYIAGVPLEIVRHPKGDLISSIRRRMYKLMGRGNNSPAFPSIKNRYCTSDHKRAPIDKVLRRADKPYFPSIQNRYCTGHHKSNQIDKKLRTEPIVISAVGIRADESKRREKLWPVSLRKQILSTYLHQYALDWKKDDFEEQLRLIETANKVRRDKQRLALNWYPIFYWSEEDVYQRCGHSIQERDERRLLYKAGRLSSPRNHNLILQSMAGWHMSPVYVMGMSRKSCTICFLQGHTGPDSDMEIGADHNPYYLYQLKELEDEGGYLYMDGFSVTDLQAYQRHFSEV